MNCIKVRNYTMFNIQPFVIEEALIPCHKDNSHWLKVPRISLRSSGEGRRNHLHHFHCLTGMEFQFMVTGKLRFCTKVSTKVSE